MKGELFWTTWAPAQAWDKEANYFCELVVTLGPYFSMTADLINVKILLKYIWTDFFVEKVEDILQSKILICQIADTADPTYSNFNKWNVNWSRALQIYKLCIFIQVSKRQYEEGIG